MQNRDGKVISYARKRFGWRLSPGLTPGPAVAESSNAFIFMRLNIIRPCAQIWHQTSADWFKKHL